MRTIILTINSYGDMHDQQAGSPAKSPPGRNHRRKPLALSLLRFIFSSAMCAVTQDIQLLIGWCFLQGFAGAGASVLSRSIFLCYRAVFRSAEATQRMLKFTSVIKYSNIITAIFPAIATKSTLPYSSNRDNLHMNGIINSLYCSPL